MKGIIIRINFLFITVSSSRLIDFFHICHFLFILKCLVFLAGWAKTGDSAGRGKSPLGFLVYVCLPLSVQGSAAFINDAFWGKREGLLILWLFSFQRALNFYCALLFSPYPSSFRGIWPPAPSYHLPSGNGAHTRWPSLVLWTFQPSLLFSLNLSMRLVFSISTLRVESSFWRWSSYVLLPPDLCISWSF